MQPEGWIRIGVDRDGDGRFEAVETIFVYDLDVAQERSRQRQQNQQNQSWQRDGQDRQDRERRSVEQDRSRRGASAGQNRMSRADENRDRQDRRRRRYSIEGTVRELTTTRIPGHDEQFLVARVRNSEGRTGRVLLGARSELEPLDLETGDRVSVSGSPATVNNQVVLIAQRVEANGNTVRPQPASEDSQAGGDDRSRRGERSGQQSRGESSERGDRENVGRRYGQDEGRNHSRDTNQD